MGPAAAGETGWTATPYPEVGVAALVGAAAGRNPGAPAVTFGGVTLTYAELDERAGRLARLLAGRGVGPETLVGVFLERSVEMVVALLAVARAGGAYVPLDPDLPAPRLAFMVEDCAAPLVVTHSALSRSLPASPARVVCIDEAEHDAGPGPSPVGAGPDDLAYVIYTSGSTGRPNGVEIPNRALVNFLTAMGVRPGLAPHDVLVAVTTLSFDIAGLELWLPLVTGAHVVVASQAVAADPRRLGQLLDDAGATVLQGTPATWRMLVAGGWTGRPGLTALCGGEALPVSLADQLLDRGVELWNLYGPTETTVWSTAGRVTERGRRPTIGRPIANTSVHVLDDRLVPAAVGETGELHIGGAGLARGYLRRPELTAARFIDDPFEPGGRLYRTGDLARRRADGEIEVLGRLDDQVKVRGFRIECGEVEAALEADPAVAAAVAVVREDTPGDPRLLAYVVPDPAWLQSRAAPDTDGAAAVRVEEWRQVYDEAQGSVATAADPRFDTSGWVSSYTGEPIPAPEMAEAVDATVARVLALGPRLPSEGPPGPRRVVELGCGTGLLLWRLAPRCDDYVGTDVSAATLAALDARVRRAGLANVRLFHREAWDFSGLPDEPADVILANSVVQYFPSVEYLRRVLSEAVARTADGGAVVLGDVRSLPLLPALHASLALAGADTSLPAGELRWRIEGGVAQERELVLDPRFFAGAGGELPGVSGVDVLLKRGVHHNELTRFRYDVVLHVGGSGGPVGVPEWLDWSGDALGVATLRRRLSEAACAGLGVTGVPNARVEELSVALDLLARPDPLATAGAVLDEARRLAGGIDPEELWNLGEEFGYDVECSWAGGDRRGAFDVAFRRPEPGPRRPVGFPGPPAAGPDRPLHNDPLAGRRREQWSQELRVELRSALRRSLPAYMVPSGIVAVDALPLTPNGKVDRRALPAPAVGRPGRGGRATRPLSAVEDAVLAIWSEVLGVDDIGVDDDFFDRGGHSLLAVRVISRVGAVLGVEVPLRTMFDSPTVAGLAGAVEGARRHAGAAAPPPLVPAGTATVEAPLSFAQESLWFLDQLDPGIPLYNMPSAYRLTGALDAGVLQDALAEIVRRHQALRTTFRSRGGRPYQHVSSPGAFALAGDDLRGLGAELADAEARRRAGAEATRPFDLAAGPLLRGSLLRLGDEEHLLLLTVHHIVADAWSTAVLRRELSALYRAFRRGDGSPLPPLAVQYADVAVWQRTWLTDEVLGPSLDHWSARLGGARPALEIPPDRPRPAVPSHRGAMEHFRIPAGLAGGLRALGRSLGATSYVILLAAFEVLLAAAAGASDIVVGGTTSGRVRAELEDLIGFLVNPVALRTDLSGDPTFVDVVSRVRATVLDAVDHAAAPFDKVVERLRPRRDLARHPVFQVAFELQEDLEPAGRLGDTVAWSDVGGPTGAAYGGGIAARLDLELFVAGAGGGALDATLVYAADVYDPATMSGFADRYLRLLEAVVADPLLRMSGVPPLS